MFDIVSSHPSSRKFLCCVCNEEKPISQKFQGYRSIRKSATVWDICLACTSVGKHCPTCKQYKLFAEYPKGNPSNWGGVVSICKCCKNDRSAKFYASQGQTEKYKLRVRDSQLRHRYKISREQYLLLFEVQGGLCAACGLPETRTDKNGRVYDLAVDHDHETGEVRDLLCFGCNAAFGLLKEDTVRIRNLLVYAEKHKT